MWRVSDEDYQLINKKRKLSEHGGGPVNTTRVFTQELNTGIRDGIDGDAPYIGGVTAIVAIDKKLPSKRLAGQSDYENRLGLYTGNMDQLYTRQGDLLMIGVNRDASKISTADVRGFSSLNGLELSADIKTDDQLRDCVTIIGASKTQHSYSEDKGHTIQYAVKAGAGVVTLVNTGPFSLALFDRLVAKIYYVPPGQQGLEMYLQKMTTKNSKAIVKNRMVPIIEPLNPCAFEFGHGVRMWTKDDVRYPKLSILNGEKKKVKDVSEERMRMEASATGRLVAFLLFKGYQIGQIIAAAGNPTIANLQQQGTQQEATNFFENILQLDSSMNPKDDATFREIIKWAVPNAQSADERRENQPYSQQKMLSNCFEHMHESAKMMMFRELDSYIGTATTPATSGQRLDVMLP